MSFLHYTPSGFPLTSLVVPSHFLLPPLIPSMLIFPQVLSSALFSVFLENETHFWGICFQLMMNSLKSLPSDQTVLLNTSTLCLSVILNSLCLKQSSPTFRWVFPPMFSPSVYVCLEVVSVIYCCLTCHPQNSGLIQQPFIIAHKSMGQLGISADLSQTQLNLAGLPCVWSLSWDNWPNWAIWSLILHQISLGLFMW